MQPPWYGYEQADSALQDVTAEIPAHGKALPLILRPKGTAVPVVEWGGAARVFLAAVLLRDFQVESVDDFRSFVDATRQGDMMPYDYGSTPRSHVSAGVYTSTEYPADRSIPMHNEMSYTLCWPRQLWFFCKTPATTGGATPLADSREVFKRIPSAIRQRFAHKQVMYVRRYMALVAVPWRQGDVLMLDNMLVAHGRGPYTGPRQILVAMATPGGVLATGSPST